MANKNLSLRSNVPPPSKVWNREYAVQRLTAELSLARQSPGYLFSILLVHFDGFRLAGRDRLGFASGSELAPRVFAVLTEDLRDNEACCHLADDEFVLILPHRDEAECRGLAALLKGKWSPKPDSRESHVTLRAGWAPSMGGESTIEKLFAAADDSLARGDAADGIGDIHARSRATFEATALRLAETQPVAGHS